MMIDMCILKFDISLLHQAAVATTAAATVTSSAATTTAEAAAAEHTTADESPPATEAHVRRSGSESGSQAGLAKAISANHHHTQIM